MSPWWVVGLVGVAGLGLLRVAAAPAAARLVAWLLVVGLAGLVLDPQAVEFAPAPARTAHAELGGGAAAGSALAAAAHAGPRAQDLTLGWVDAFLVAAPPGPLGARAAFPGKPLPLQPEALQVRALQAAAVGRPTTLQVEAPGLVEPCDALLTVQVAGREVLQTRIRLEGARPTEAAFLPGVSGLHTVAVELTADGHRVVRTGELVVAEPPRVLVLEASGVAAAALRAQGMAVVEAAALPADWRTHAALVVGSGLPADQQQELVAAVLDGMGLFVLAPGFGAAEEPMRALLPCKPAPVDGPGAGQGGAGGPPSPSPAPTEPRPEPQPPPVDRPPSGDTSGAKPVSNEPVEVDKHEIAMVLVVDRSGSMGQPLSTGKSKMSYAKTSALKTAQALGEGDQVGIVTFGNKSRGRVELALTDASDLATVRGGVEKLAHGQEYTYLLSGLQAAQELLAGHRAAVKHVVVITDGEFDSSESVALRRLAFRMRSESQVTVSVISIVDGRTEPQFLREAEELTRDGGGQFLPVEDPTSVPVFVSAEVTRALQRVGRKPRTDPGGKPNPQVAEAPPPKPPEPPVQPPKPAPTPPPAAPARLAVRAVAESPVLAPLPAEAWPTLGAAVAGTAPFDAQVLLVAGDAGWPLLAYGNRGLGRVGAFAADVCGPPGVEFRSEAAFSARFAQWVQNVMPVAPARRPAALLTTIAVTPAAPTPRELQELAALAGTAAVPAATLPPGEPTTVVRLVRSRAGEWALGALLGVLLLALAERYFGWRGWRRGAPEAE